MDSARHVVTAVHYPGLAGDPRHELAQSQFIDGLGGGMLSFDTEMHLATVNRFLDELHLAVPGTSLGDVKTLVLNPAMSSHRVLSAEGRPAPSIRDGLIRVSVGLESPEDVIADFDCAFEAVYS